MPLGIVGELHPAVVAEWDLPPQRVCAWDLSVEALFSAVPGRNLYSPISPYAPVKQDMAFLVAAETPVAQVADLIRASVGKDATDVSLFDVYTGKPIPEGQKSLAFAVTFSSAEKLLTEEDVARLRKRIEGRLQRELGATLRS